MSKILRKFIKIISQNKALLAFVIFAVLLLIGGKNSFIKIMRLESETRALEQKRDELKERIREDSLYLRRLNSDNEVFERYLREKYYFHRPNEDVYIIRDL